MNRLCLLFVDVVEDKNISRNHRASNDVAADKTQEEDVDNTITHFDKIIQVKMTEQNARQKSLPFLNI